MARYGNQKTPFTEDMDPMPVDPYGVSKVAAEEVLKIMSSVHNFDYTIAVPHNIVGPYQKYDDPFRNVMSIMLNRLMQKNKPAIIYGDGTQTRCFSYIDDCIQCLEKMAFDQSTNSEIINIGPDEETINIKELADFSSNVVGTNIPHEYYSEGRPTEVKHATCSSNKARKILNYKTSTGIKEAILKTYNFIKEKGPKEFKYNYDLEIVNNKTQNMDRKENINSKENNNKKYDVTIIGGAGHVGLPLGLSFANKKIKVCLLDINKKT